MNLSLSQQMKAKFFAEGYRIPKCVNEGCDRNVLVREWKYWSFKSECSRCTDARKNGKIIPGVTIHKKSHCENHNGHLGWVCPVPRDGWIGFENSLDLDHLDGDHFNNVPENVRTYCKLCHGRKSLINGDCDSNKSSGRKLQWLKSCWETQDNF
jgi:hypothetical protein